MQTGIMSNHASSASFLTFVFGSCMIVCASANPGCYNTATHACSCNVIESACTGSNVWSEQCTCAVHTGSEIPMQGTWSSCGTYRGQPTGFCPSSQNLTASTGDYLEFSLGAGADVMSVDTSAAYDSCTVSEAKVLANNVHSKAGYMTFKMVFNDAGTYYLTSSNTCSSGVKMKITVSGTDKGDNEFTAFKVLAPSSTANPNDDDDFVAFGKGVYHKRATDHDLTSLCTSAYCLDKKVSRGSCYYAGSDFHIGHATFCDVSEEECCGYIGCKGDYPARGGKRGKFQNNETYHNYYWYPPSAVRGDGCCMCFGGCDRSKENSTKAPGGVCSYRDVTSAKTATTEECQRTDSIDTLDANSIGFLDCPVPDDMPSILVETDKMPENMILRISQYYDTSSAPRSHKYPSIALASIGTLSAMMMTTEKSMCPSSRACALIIVVLMIFVQSVSATRSLNAIKLSTNTPPALSSKNYLAPPFEDAAFARYLAHMNSYGVVSTISVHLDGQAFSNVMSCSDGIGNNSTGRLFFYMTDMDPTGADLTQDSRASVTFSQAQIVGEGSCAQVDPEDRACGSLTIAGDIVEVSGTDKIFALEALFSRNPPMKHWPRAHGWIVFEMKPVRIILVRGNEISSEIAVAEYFSASPNFESRNSEQEYDHARHLMTFMESAKAISAKSSWPLFPNKAKAARKMVHDANWGVLSMLRKDHKGPFAYVKSVSDGPANVSTGRLWFFLNTEDSMMHDVKTNNNVSFTISQAMIDAELATAACHDKIAEEPTCGRITFSGKLIALTSATEIAGAEKALFARHPSMSQWKLHGKFHPFELVISDIFFLNLYGGARPLSVRDYFAASPI